MRIIILLCLLSVNVSNAQNSTQTIAIQALFSNESAIDALREKAEIYDNITSARSLGARPHMTIASFNVTENEVDELENNFQLLDNQYSSHSFTVKVMVETDDSTKWSYYLVPVDKDEVLIKIHDKLYTTVDKGYQKQRDIDMPGNWWPHISLFVVHGNSPKITDSLLVELGKIKRVTIKGFSLVSFGAIDYFKEIRTVE